MGLTLEAEQRLKDVGLIEFYENTESTWNGSVQKTYNFVKRNFPKGALIRRDDVAKAFIPIIEVNESLRNKLNEDKLRGKHWITSFANLVIDRAWDQLTQEKDT